MLHQEKIDSQTRAAGPKSPRRPDLRVRRIIQASVALALLLCLVIGGFFIIHNNGATPTPMVSSAANNAHVALPKPWCAAPDALSTTFSGTSIASLATNDVWSVGSQIMHWNGSSWKTSFTPASPQDALRSIVELARDDVWVVGEQQTDSMPSHALAVHWDGTQWQSATLPDAAQGGKNSLVSVSGSAANDIWAVGFAVPLQGSIVPLLEHWNGTQWSIVHLNASTSMELTSVKALTARDAWAVGYTYGVRAGKQFVQPLTENWDGSKWSSVINPDLSAASGGNLYSISGDATNDLWAVGNQNNGSALLTEHWNGRAWSIVASPAVPPGNSNWLASVVVNSPDSVWAVGRVTSSQGGYQSFIEHWNGLQWQAMQDPTGNAGEMDAVAIVGQQFWVVGLPRTGGGHAFIETLCP